MSEAITIHTQGLGGDEALMIWPDRNYCGDIKDGVCLQVLHPSLRGVFVIAFDDLERAYLAAKEVRENDA